MDWLTRLVLRAVGNSVKSRGFTIIETLIVLAIAGLILLLIFMLLPVLERNGRNNQRQQDVSAILAAVSHYELNNTGGFPQTCGTTAANLCGLTGGPLAYAKLTFYDDTTAGLVTINQLVSTSPAPNLVIISDTVEVYNYSKCGTSSSSPPVSAGFNNFVVLYALETGGAAAPQCREL